MRADKSASSRDIGEPTGKLVNVNGRAVHVQCLGEGKPTVWLENGWAGVVPGWQPFHNMLAQHTRVCAYDRAGYGWSEPNGIDRSAQNEADEFAELLEVMGQDEPIILVAWSGGGPVAQIFAADHPELVAGLVLIDVIPPDYDLWAIQTFPDRYWQERQQHLETIRENASRAAAGTLKQDNIPDWFNETILEQFGERYVRLITNNSDYWWAYYWENQFVITSGAQVKAKVAKTDMPITVIIADQLPDDHSIYRQSLARMWQTMQNAQAARSTQGEVIRIDAGHAVFRDRPQTVVDAIMNMINMIK